MLEVTNKEFTKWVEQFDYLYERSHVGFNLAIQKFMNTELSYQIESEYLKYPYEGEDRIRNSIFKDRHLKYIRLTDIVSGDAVSLYDIPLLFTHLGYEVTCHERRDWVEAGKLNILPKELTIYIRDTTTNDTVAFYIDTKGELQLSSYGRSETIGAPFKFKDTHGLLLQINVLFNLIMGTSLNLLDLQEYLDTGDSMGRAEADTKDSKLFEEAKILRREERMEQCRNMERARMLAAINKEEDPYPELNNPRYLQYMEGITDEI